MRDNGVGGSGRGAFVLIKQLKLLNPFSGLSLPIKDTFLKLVAGKLTPDLTQWSFSCSASKIFQYQHAKKVHNGMDS